MSLFRRLTLLLVVALAVPFVMAPRITLVPEDIEAALAPGDSAEETVLHVNLGPGTKGHLTLSVCEVDRRLADRKQCDRGEAGRWTRVAGGPASGTTYEFPTDWLGSTVAVRVTYRGTSQLLDLDELDRV